MQKICVANHFFAKICFRKNISAMIQEEVFTEGIQTIETDYETERGKPMPSINHSVIQIKLGTALQNHYGKKFTIGSETDLDLPKATRPTVPDISIFEKRTLRLSRDIIKMKEPPLTTIEILCPSQILDDVRENIFDYYFPAGVKSAWIIIPGARTVSIYTPDEKFKTYSSGKFTDPATDITLDIDEVFEDME